MIRISIESEQGWELKDTVEALPSDFAFQSGVMVEQDNEDGTVTILWQHETDIEEPSIDNVESLKTVDEVQEDITS